jgi:hypothetical protein
MLKIYIKQMGRDVVDWIHLVQDRGKRRAVVNYGMSLRIPKVRVNFLIS